MFTGKETSKPSPNWLSWELSILFLALFGFIIMILEKPQGSIEGQIALGQDNFGLSSYNLRKNKVYAVASGPRYGRSISRGVWVNNDGRFEISQLPVGEYSLRLRAPGFQTKYINSILVEENKATSTGKTIKLRVLNPHISLGSNMRVFTTIEEPSFWVRATGAISTTVRVYKKNILKELESKKLANSGVDCGTDLSLYPTYNRKFLNPYLEEKPFKQFKRDLQANHTDSARANFKLSKGMPEGDYIVVAEALGITGKKRVSTISWFSVSNIGLIVKHAPSQTLVRAIDLRSLKPVSGAEISISNRTSGYKKITPLKTANTNDVGLAIFNFESGPQTRRSSETLVIGRAANSTAYGGASYWRGSEKQYKSYFYTDRPVYRLGQKVSYKLISRILNEKGMSNPGMGVPIQVTVEDPTNSRLESKTIKTSKYGTSSSTFNIPEDGKTGSYQIRFRYPGGSTAYKSFTVEQYRKPEYKVEIIPDSKRYIAGGKVKAKVRATYYFGAPVANAHIKYSVYESPDSWTRFKIEPRPSYYSFFDDWYDESYYDQYSYGGTFIKEGQSTTDSNGEAEIIFDAKKVVSEHNRPYFFNDYGEKTYKIEADVTDISQLTVSSSSNTLITAANFALFVEPQSYVVKAGAPFKSKIRAISYDGKPIANKSIKVKLSRFPYDRAKNSYRPEKVLAEVASQTDGKGEAEISFSVGQNYPTDTFYITAQAQDENGNLTYHGNSVWVASDSYPYVIGGDSLNKESFKVTLDKKVYKPGETAKVMISGPFSGSEGIDALVTVEGTKIHEYSVKPIKATANLIEVPIKDDYNPNVFISVTAVGAKKQFYNQSKMIQVSPGNHFLDLTVKTNKDKYKPGETASYLITAKYKDGKPAANCELSLGVVDESLYSIRSDSTMDIRKFFFKKRYNWVNTLCSFPEQYSGGPDKASPKIRKNFKDTAAWLPHLVTDDNGEAVATVKLPDNLTTWRATVRAISKDTDVGSSVNKITVSKNIIARLVLPRFFTKGDNGQIAAIVHNYTNTDQEIAIKLNLPDNFKTTIPLAKTLSITKEGVEKFSWPIKVKKTGEAKLTLTASGQAGSDGLEKSIKINPLGIRVSRVRQGVLNEKNPTVNLNQIVDPKAIDLKSSLKLAGSTFAQLRGSYGSLINYPYGCTEQTMSRLVPSIVAYKMHKNFGISLSSEQLEKFEKAKRKSIRRLKDLQHYDGGWGWWSNDSSDPYLTAYVLEGLKLLKEASIANEKYLTKSGITWLNKNTKELHRQLSDPKLIEDYSARARRVDLARMVYVQSLYGIKPDSTILKWLDSKVSILPPEPLSYLTMANKKLGNLKYANKAYSRLLFLANKTDNYLDWEHNVSMRKKMKHDPNFDYTYRFTGVETTALALKAIVNMEPENTAQIEKVKNWILVQRSKEGWSNTKTTAQVLLSLIEEAIKTGNEEASSIVAEILSDDSVLNSLTLNQSQIFTREIVKPLQSSIFEKDIKLTMQGSGRLYYQQLSDYYRALEPGEKFDIENSPKQLSLARKFFRIKTHATKSDGTLQLRALPLNNSSIKPGEILLMKVYVNTPISLPYVIVECPLPSGAEVVKSKGAKGNLANEEGNSLIEGDWGSPWWSHQDILDDKLVFFGNKIPQGKSEFHTLIRMELPGSVNLNPIKLEGMYTNMVKGYCQPKILKVEQN